MRTKFIAGNWKMFTNRAIGAEQLAEGGGARGVGSTNGRSRRGLSTVSVSVCRSRRRAAGAAPIQLGAQNAYPEKEEARSPAK